MLQVTFVVLIFIAALFVCDESRAQDPTDIFIIAADSIMQTGDEQALAEYVAERVVIVGAAVHQVIDVAVIVGDDGKQAAEEENFVFAEHISRLYFEETGSKALLELVQVYRNWTPGQRERRRQAKALEEQANEARSEKDYERAAALINEAKDIYTRIGDRYSEAIVWGSLGVVYWYAGDFDSVMDHYEQALTKRRTIENRILEGRTLNGLGTAHFILQDYDAAAQYYLQAIELRTETEDLSGLGTSLTYLGNTFYYLGRLVDARESYELALKVIEQVGTPMQRFELLSSIANLDYDMGRINRSREVYHEALLIALELEDVGAELVCRLNIALRLKNAFRYREALEELDRVEELLTETQEPQYIIAFYRNRGHVYYEMGEYGRAREDLLTFLEKAKKYEAIDSELDALIRLGYLMKELGAYENGLAFADSALVKAQGSELFARAREAHMLSAQLERMMGRPERAIDHWEQALEQDRSDQAEARILEDELGIANAMALAGQFDEARRMLHALRPRIHEVGSLNLLLPLNLNIAHSFETTNPDSARHYYERALSIMEETRAGVGGAELGTGYISGSTRYFYEEVARFYARVAMETKDESWSSEALRTIERAKARGLLDLIGSSLASEYSSEEEAVLDSIYRLDPGAPNYSRDFRRLERQYERIRDKRIENSAGALECKHLITDVNEVRKQLPKKTTMFVYALGDTASLLWVIDRKGHELFMLPPRADLRQDVELLKSSLTAPGTGDAALKRLARKLYGVLIEPGMERAGRAEQLIIIPDGCLFEVPYEVMLTGDPGDGDDWGSLPYLARSYAATYAPSVSVYLRLRESEKAKYDIDIIAVGDPDYAVCRGEDASSLRQLPFSRAEIDGIGEYFKDDKREFLLGIDANEAIFRGMLEERRPRLLHLAAHGLVDPINPASSSIALCPDPEGREDGYLHTLEILSLPIDSRLVVLSACESARGRIRRGEGVVGLSRAFLAAGASGVVCSLWAVSDESTAQLMQTFYHRMVKKKKPASLALNEARMELLGDPRFSHPFHWSSFIVIGSERTPR